MSFTKQLEFGNYTLTFGSDLYMIDFFSEIVMPSFVEMKYIRRIRDKADYFFLDTELIQLNNDDTNPVLGICGRIVKNTKLRREQIFRANGGIIEDRSELETAPSSTFLLIINNHRLILSKEVPGAPSIQNFQSTSQYCLNESRDDLIEKLYAENTARRNEDSNTPRLTKKSLREKYKKPRLRITPLSDRESLRDFVDRLAHIDRVAIKLLPTNKEEIDNDDFWRDFGRRREEMKSNSAKVEFSNPKDGLDQEEVYKQTSSASNLGNSEIKFRGYDSEGDTIKGSNEDFSLSVELEDMPKDAKKAANEKFAQFNSLVQTGVISLPKLNKDWQAPDTVDAW